jgi:hypothetical protein
LVLQERTWRQPPRVGTFLCPTDHRAGRAWVRDLVTLSHDLDPTRPLTCGLHMASLHRDNGLRVDEVFAETDIAVWLWLTM